MRKHNQIHTLGARHYKAYFDFLENWRILSVLYGLKNTVIHAAYNQGQLTIE